MIKKSLRLVLINLSIFYFLLLTVPGIHLRNGSHSFFILVASLIVIHGLVKPLINTFLRPLNLLTFGFLGLFIDVGLLFFFSHVHKLLLFQDWTFPGLTLEGFPPLPGKNFSSLETLLVSALILGLMRLVLFFIFL